LNVSRKSRKKVKKFSDASQRSAVAAADRRRLPLRRKVLFAGITTVLVFAVVESTLWLLNVQPAYVAEDPYAGFSRHIPHFVESDVDGRTVLEVSASKDEVLNPQQFAAAKEDGVFRIICVGGSTTYGRPFFDATSFPGWLRALLPEVAPESRWEVINAGGISYASYRVLGVMEELAACEPDLFVVYTGQNEFLERRTYDGWTMSNAVAGPLSLIYRTRTATVVRGVLDAAGLRGGGQSGPLLGEETEAIPIDAVGPDSYQRDEQLSREVAAHFRSTLNSMCGVAEAAGARILFVVPASNLADFAPFRSEHRAGLSEARQQQWARHEQAARSLFADGDADAALQQLELAENIDDRHAGLWYLKGQILTELQQYAAARLAFEKARDEDVCPLRAVQPLVDIVRAMQQQPGVTVVDFEKLVKQNSEHGLPGDAMFHDHVHPTIAGNQLLAAAIIDELNDLEILSAAADWRDQTLSRVTQQVLASLDRAELGRQLRLLSFMMGWLNQPDAARTQADLSLEYSGRTAAALLDLAAGLQANDAPGLALEYLREAASIAPDSADVHFQFGVASLDADDTEQGLQELQKAVRLDPRHAEARERLGIALAMQGELKPAEEHLKVAVVLRPDAAMARSNLGLVVAKQQRFEEALRHYNASLALDNRISSTHYNAGLACEELGLLEDARLHYQATIQLADGHAAAEERLRELYEKHR
jgi:tetratricopeptide (TPR) repeat protein